MYSICSLVAALAIGGYLVTAHTGGHGKSSQASQPVAQAGEVAGEESLRQATLTLAAHHVEAGTYAGAVLDGVTLVRATATTYCMQAGAGPTAAHQTDTDTESVPGPC
jgi:hypothetical protein